ITCCFSSGRRHTRFKCDWSSDVCSSDLSPLTKPALTVTIPRGTVGARRNGYRQGGLGERAQGTVGPGNVTGVERGDPCGLIRNQIGRASCSEGGLERDCRADERRQGVEN